MKILYYSPHPHLNLMSPSGYGTHMREMITAFREEGNEVLPVIMGGVENPPQETLQQNNHSFKQRIKKAFPKNLWRSLRDIWLLKYDTRAAKNLEKAIRTFRPHCIYERCNYLQLSGVKMAQKYDIKHVLEINTPYIEQINSLSKSHSWLEKYAERIEKKQIENTDLALALVTPLKEYYCQRYNVDPNKFLVTHDAFNKDNISISEENQQKILERYRLKDKTIVGYLGSIFEWHKLDKVIKAVPEMDNLDFKLFIVGYGAYMRNLVKLVEQMNLEERVIFVGKVPKEEVFDYIAIMDICVAPGAAWYQSPVKIFEYGAMGKPIMAPDTKAVRELMEHDRDGILINGSVDSIKDALQRLLTNEEERRYMGLHFQKKVLNRYTWRKNAQRVLEALL